MIKKLSSSSLITQVDTSAQKTRAAFGKTALNTDLNLAEIISRLSVESDQLAEAIKRSKHESELEEKDLTLLEEGRGLYYFVSGLRYHPDMEVSAAAHLVMDEIEKYGLGIFRESFDVQTSLVSSLLDDLKKPKIVAAIALLTGVETRVARLDAAENDFEQSSLANDEAKAQAGNTATATEIKKRVLDVINDQLVNYLRVMVLANEAVYGDFARTVAQIIDNNNAAVKRRRKNSDTEPEE